MIGKNHKSAIGTIVERKFRYIIIVKLKSKKSDEVVKMFS
jgi:IS30 family transposase